MSFYVNFKTKNKADEVTVRKLLNGDDIVVSEQECEFICYGDANRVSGLLLSISIEVMDSEFIFYPSSSYFSTKLFIGRIRNGVYNEMEYKFSPLDRIEFEKYIAEFKNEKPEFLPSTVDMVLSFHSGNYLYEIDFNDFASNIDGHIRNLEKKKFDEFSLLTMSWIDYEHLPYKITISDNEFVEIMNLCDSSADIVFINFINGRFQFLVSGDYPNSLNYISKIAKDNEWYNKSTRTLMLIDDEDFIFELAEKKYYDENINILKYIPENLLSKRLLMLNTLRS